MDPVVHVIDGANAAWCTPRWNVGWGEAAAVRSENSTRERAAVAALDTAYNMLRVISPDYRIQHGRRSFTLSALDALDDFRSMSYYMDDAGWFLHPIVCVPPIGRSAGDEHWHFERSNDLVAEVIARWFQRLPSAPAHAVEGMA